MRLVFAGTPAFSVPALDALVKAGHEIAAVYSQPDRPAGRGRKLTASPVALRAEQLGIPAFKPEKLRGNDAAIDQLRALRPDCMIVVAYGLILPQAVLDVPAHGCLNIHASLLPRWRGAAPIQRAVLAGDRETGVTIMRMDAGLDTGPMLLRETVPISEQTTSGELQERLSSLGAELMVRALALLEKGQLTEQAQADSGDSYAAKITKQEAQLDWSEDAQALLRRIHGYNPMPGAWSLIANDRIKLLRARCSEHAPDLDALPGTVIAIDEAGLHVATGRGALCVTELQRPGSKIAAAAQAFRGRSIAGTRFQT